MQDTWTEASPGVRVVVAMSGGVDSSVAAALLVEQGCAVIGVTMKNFCYGDAPVGRGVACCSMEAIADARSVARRLGIVHHVLDFEGPFRAAVLDPFVAEYGRGRTPNPCVRCNRFVRFPRLWRTALALGAERVATGHYARAVRGPDGIELRRPADRDKDQTFYLWGLGRALLERALFPLGGLTKDVVRERARALGLVTAERPESQDICFIPDGDLRGFLARHQADHPALAPPDRFAPGPIRTADGAVVGTHAGTAFYTVGQRRGLGVAAAEPLYVTAIGPDNDLVVGTAGALEERDLELEDACWLLAPPAESFDAEVQIRSRSPAAPARRASCSADAASSGTRPQRAIAPGQSAVVYTGDRLLGGGTIAAAGRPSAAGTNGVEAG